MSNQRDHHIFFISSYGPDKRVNCVPHLHYNPPPDTRRGLPSPPQRVMMSYYAALVSPHAPCCESTLHSGPPPAHRAHHHTTEKCRALAACVCVCVCVCVYISKHLKQRGDPVSVLPLVCMHTQISYSLWN